MDYLQKFTSQFRRRLLLLFLLNNLLVVIGWWVLAEVLRLRNTWFIAAVAVAAVCWLLLSAWIATKYLTQPTRMIWQAILHIAPGATDVLAPKPDSAFFGRELIANLANQVYQLATTAASFDVKAQTEQQDLHHNPIATSLPLPLFVLDKNHIIVFANEAALRYIAMPEGDVMGKNFYAVLDLAFSDNHTLDAWLDEARTRAVTATQTWERVRLNTPDKRTLLFDLAAYYNQANPLGYETLIMLFDHTKQYSEDDQALGFVALAVHELRTPLTLLRGYIEALEESSEHTLSATDATLVQRMEAAAHQLANFTNNVLNVARIEDDQFLVQLHEESWPQILEPAINDMRLQASVRGIAVETKVAANLPPVGVDRVSVYEVICNLIDNAIKYSAKSGKKIIVDAHLADNGFVETTVQDFGVGIPESVMPNLFDKFYRSHRSRAQIGGTGLGLYLSKIIINAQGGNIWVRSKEGQGSTFGFTVLPYAKLAPGQQHAPEDLTRIAHGWIKNHSLYRR